MAAKSPHEVAKMRENAAKKAKITIEATATGKSKHLPKGKKVILAKEQYDILLEKGAINAVK